MTTRRVLGAALGFGFIILNIAIIALVVISTSQRGWSGLLGRETTETAATAAPTTPPSSPTTPSPTDATPSSTRSGDTTPTTASPTTTPEPEPEPTLAERYADGEALTVVVLGDQTGVDPADWVLAWARQLSGAHAVEVYATSTGDPTLYLGPETLGLGEPRITLYNASHIGNTPGYAANRLGALLPEDPDVVLLNFGRSNDQEDITDELQTLWESLTQDRDLDTRVVIQPPRQDGQPPLDELTRQWTEDSDAETIDVAAVFEEEGIVWSTVSVRDPLSVNIYGAGRWAEIVQSELLGGE
ncbi:SGNH/GDSL hydrolase family protein [Ornithinicoccus hortensis]|nr:SGNH/GDSL hydrolase family protein [Ornithinicoccus hortensis]